MGTSVIGDEFIGRYLVATLSDSSRKAYVINRIQQADHVHMSSEVTYGSGDLMNCVFRWREFSGEDEVVVVAYFSTSKTSYDNLAWETIEKYPGAAGLSEQVRELQFKKNVLPHPTGPFAVTLS